MNTFRISRRKAGTMLVAGSVSLGLLRSTAGSGEGKADRPKVLMPIGDATEMMDTLYPFFRLPEDGFEVIVAGPEARLYNGVAHEVPPNANVPWDITEERPSYHIEATIAFRDAKPDDYVGLFLSGGRAGVYPLRQGSHANHPAFHRFRQADRGGLPWHRDPGGRGRTQGWPAQRRWPSASSTSPRTAVCTSRSRAWSTETSLAPAPGTTTVRRFSGSSSRR